MSALRHCRAGLFSVMIVSMASMSAPARADDAVGGSPGDVLSLQRRLADAGCYTGAVDGAPSAALDAAVKACPEQQPTLRIETGMHTATIWRAGVDAACTRLVTASDDRTVRLWSLPDGTLERTFRLPIAEGNGGKMWAVAMSPDGRWLAAGGWDASWDKTSTMSVSVVDLQTGATRRFGAFENVIHRIAYSADGRRIAVGLDGKYGLRVLDSATGAELLADRNYGDSIYGLTFTPDGSLITTSYDGSLRRYNPDLRLTAKRAAPSGKQPYAVAVDPAGRRAAVGYDNIPKVSIVDAITLAPIADADTSDIKTLDFSKVAWSRDGSFVAAGTVDALFNNVWRTVIRHFNRDGRRLGPDHPIESSNTIMDIQRCGDGFVFAAAEPIVGKIDANGVPTTLQGPRTADMRSKLGGAFLVSSDAMSVRFGQEPGAVKPVLLDLVGASLIDSPEAPAGLTAPLVAGLPVTDWQDNYNPKFRGAPIVLDSYERSRSVAIRPDHSGFVLGTEYYIRAYDAAGKERWKQSGASIGWGVNFSADGQIIVVASGDGTIRWLRWSDGKELLAFFVDVPTRKWVAWTPTGYYIASAGAEDLIGWHVNRGWAQLADFFPASRFSARFNRPDIVQIVLRTRDEEAAIKEANSTIQRKVDLTPIVAQLPPVTAFVSPAMGTKFSGNSVEVTFTVRSPSGLPIDGVQALIDGRPVSTRGLAPAPQPLSASEGKTETRRLTIPAPPRDFELALIARSGALIGEPAKLKLSYAGAVDTNALKPKLYLVTIGVSDYVDPDMRLGYAADDARGFGEALRAQVGGLYGEVKELPPLVDRAVTRASVISALRWLRKQVTERDIGMVLIAGHGATDDGQNYWFLPSDATREDLDSNGVSQDDLLRELRQVAGKTILFLDTCHANQAAAGGVLRRGSTNIDGVINEFTKAENGLVVFSSSRGRETSQESPSWGHGAFTKALIEGLGEGKADMRHDGAITLSELDAFVAERVKELTNGDQHPVMTRPPTMQDFAFAVAK